MVPAMRVLRVYHAGRDRAHRARDRALAAMGIDLTLVVPSHWSGEGNESTLSEEPFTVVELDVTRSGDVNRHAPREPLHDVVRSLAPDVLDIHEEPVSLAARQWLAAAPADLPIVMYTAQNVDKRFPPPFSRYERTAYRRATALYPCSRQAASVARGKGFAGAIEVLPLGYDDSEFHPGSQALDTEEVVLALVGRLVPEKGVRDAIQVLARVNATRPARLVIVGSGPEKEPARQLAASSGLSDRVEFQPWLSSADLARCYRSAHVVLMPSVPTHTWVEQFGRVIVEAQASGAVVAGYRSGSIPEVAQAAGLLVDTGEPRQLADAVARVLADREDFDRRRAAGLALAAGRTWSEVARRQHELYRRALETGTVGAALPESPARRRAAARAEFGPTARSAAGVRPFAVPFLRRERADARLLASLCDVVAELEPRVRRRFPQRRA
jgi:glycosyltransferase involved in cell wall biosynthesis